MAGTVLFSIMVYDPSVSVGDWIVEGEWRWKRYKLQVV